MSAYIVSREHIDVLIAVGRFGPRGRPVSPGHAWHTLHWWDTDPRALEPDQYGEHRKELNELTEDAVGDLLVGENLSSVRHRYPTTPNDLPGPVDAYWRDLYAWRDPHVRLTAVEGLQALRGYEYQACEHPGWETSEAHAFCEALRHALIAALPGMDDAPWEWTAETIAAHRRPEDHGLLLSTLSTLSTPSTRRRTR